MGTDGLRLATFHLSCFSLYDKDERHLGEKVWRMDFGGEAEGELEQEDRDRLDGRKRKRTRLLLRSVYVSLMLCSASFSSNIMWGLDGTPGHISASMHRQRLSIQGLSERMTEADFVKMLRLPVSAFTAVFNKIAPHLQQDGKSQAKAVCSSGSIILPEVRFIVTILWLAGGSHLDLHPMYGISKGAFYNSVWMVISAILLEYGHTLCFPVDDPAALKDIEEGFRMRQPKKGRSVL